MSPVFLALTKPVTGLLTLMFFAVAPVRSHHKLDVEAGAFEAQRLELNPARERPRLPAAEPELPDLPLPARPEPAPDAQPDQ